jgi:peroxiredoxin
MYVQAVNDAFTLRRPAMKRTFIILLLSTLAVGVTSGQAPIRPEARAVQGGDVEGPIKRLEARVAHLETSHAELVAELTAIQKQIEGGQLEQAVKACQAVIAARTRVHEEELKTLERQLDYLKRMAARRTRTRRPVGIGQRAQFFQAQTLTGETVKLKDYQDKVIVLEWINFSCPYSRYHYKTKKTMIELANRYQSQGVVWVAVNSTPTVTADDYQAFLKSIGVDALPYPVVDDHEGKIGQAFGATVTPQVMIIDKTGKIAYSGSVDNAPLGKTRPAGAKTINHVDRALSELLNDRPVSTLETVLMGSAVKYTSPPSAKPN